MEFSLIEFRLHAVQRMFERGIRVTVYEPDPSLWQAGYERRK